MTVKGRKQRPQSNATQELRDEWVDKRRSIEGKSVKRSSQQAERRKVSQIPSSRDLQPEILFALGLIG